MLKTNTDPGAGREAYAVLLDSDDVDSNELPAQVWADAATAAYFNWAEHGEPGDLKWAKSLRIRHSKWMRQWPPPISFRRDIYWNPASLEGLWAVLGQVEPGALSVRSRERFTVHAALILIESEQPREAVALIESALLVKADSHDLYLALAFGASSDAQSSYWSRVGYY